MENNFIHELFKKYCDFSKDANDYDGIQDIFFRESGYNVETAETIPIIEKIFINHKAQICYSHIVATFLQKKYNYDIFTGEVLKDICSLIKIKEIRECMMDKHKRLPFKYYCWLNFIREKTCSSLTFITISIMMSQLAIYFMENEQQLNILFVNIEKTLGEIGVLVNYNRNTTSTFYMFDNIMRTLLTKLNQMEIKIKKIENDAEEKIAKVEEVFDDLELAIEENVREEIGFFQEKDEKENSGISKKEKEKEKVIQDNERSESLNPKVDNELKPSNFGFKILMENIIVEDNDKKIKKQRYPHVEKSNKGIMGEIFIKNTEKIINKKKELEIKICDKCDNYKQQITGMNNSIIELKKIIENLRKEIIKLVEDIILKENENEQCLKDLKEFKNKSKTNIEYIEMYEKCLRLSDEYKKNKRVYKKFTEKIKEKISNLEEIIDKKNNNIRVFEKNFEDFFVETKLNQLKFLSPTKICKNIKKEYKICIGFERLLNRYVNKDKINTALIKESKKKEEDNCFNNVLGIHHSNYTKIFLKKLLPSIEDKKIDEYAETLMMINVRYTRLLTRCEAYSILKYIQVTGLKRKKISWLWYLLSGVNNHGLDDIKKKNDILFYKFIAPEYKYDNKTIKIMKEEFDSLTPQEVKTKYRKAFIMLDFCSFGSVTSYSNVSKKYNDILSYNAIELLQKHKRNDFNYDNNERIYNIQYTDNFGSIIEKLDYMIDSERNQFDLSEKMKWYGTKNFSPNEVDEERDLEIIDWIGNLKKIAEEMGEINETTLRIIEKDFVKDLLGKYVKMKNKIIIDGKENKKYEKNK